MNLTLSEDQTLIKESARKFLDYNYTFEKRREIIESENNSYLSHWQDYAELGWLGLPFSEEVGGFDEVCWTFLFGLPLCPNIASF